MTQNVALIDYGSGNLHSAAKALERAAQEGEVSIALNVTAAIDEVMTADQIVLPGVGAFGDCMSGLSAIDGMVEALNCRVRDQGIPFLGICVGMQLLAEIGEEHGSHKGLGWIPGTVKALAPSDPNLKIPHMGWNALTDVNSTHPILQNIENDDRVYFVHSYQMTCSDSFLQARTNYGGGVTACVGTENIFGTQFHPEKSQSVGLRLLRNFLKWSP